MQRDNIMFFLNDKKSFKNENIPRKFYFQVLQYINDTVLQNVFSPVLSDDLNMNDLPKVKINDNATSSTYVIDTYVYAIGLVHELSQHDASWLEFLSMLMENRYVINVFFVSIA